MKLLTEEIISQLPPLGSGYGEEDPIIRVKFFMPGGEWRWYVTEGEPELEINDFIFYGYVVGIFPEWGNFRLSELKEARGWMGLPVERDLFFGPRRFSQLTAAELGVPDPLQE
jgi:hypothetical protein